MTALRIRRFNAADLDAVRQVYRHAIEHLGPSAYTPEQVQAWASFADDPGFAEWIQNAQTFVAADESGTPQGFGGLQLPGYLSALFVAPAYLRQGVGRGLLEELLSHTDPNQPVTVAASAFSKPLFEQYGFVVEQLERSRFKGVDFLRYALIRPPEVPGP